MKGGLNFLYFGFAAVMFYLHRMLDYLVHLQLDDLPFGTS